MRRRIQIAMMAAGCWLQIAGLSAQVNIDSLIPIYTKKIQKYLDKEKKAADVFSLTKAGIQMYVPATDTSPRKPDLFFSWIQLIKPLRFPGGLAADIQTPKPLRGFLIALDPGHIAGDLETAKLEKKWVEMKASNIKLIEGELTLATALILQKKLEAQGAKVMLTRDKPNISAFGLDFKTWKDSLFVNAVAAAYAREDISFEERNYLLTKANDTEIFRRFFLLEDLRERARKINEFHPDMTLVIHYNVDETNTSWNKPTKKNYNMAFVGGSFMEDEFDSPEARMEFLRLLLTDDIERSVEFSRYMMESLVQKTGVPAAIDSNAVYLRDNSMKTEAKGVFSRNLTLTRKVKGVICYGESLYQDNSIECKTLCKKEITIEGIQTSHRVGQVAEAYYEGIMNYVKKKQP